MELKKYLSFDGLNKYDSLIKMRTDEKLSDKQNKDFIVEFADESNTTVTKSVAEIATAVESGTHVKFFDGGEYLDLLGCSTADNFALFYAAYCIGGEWNIKTCAIVGTSVMENVTEKYNYATKDSVDSKQDTITGTEGQVIQIDATGKAVASDLDLITVEDVDAICGGAISYADDVMF